MDNGRRLVALIVDNPLRDLDGLVLLAVTLAQRGVDAALVPMYDQGFDIPALAPDLVVANYVRANNRDLIARYRSLGMKVVVLDSEGAAGKTAADYARMVARAALADLVDDYCVWGRSRHDALVATGALPASRVHLTGCPRYDFCAEPWVKALPEVADGEGFILVNTNFSLPNPRFASSMEEERRTLERVWGDVEYVAGVYREAGTAFQGMLSAIGNLAERFSAVPVVVRPHPFESNVPYERLQSRGNLRVRQEGTSLEWIRAASVLVHQNCMTAVEAVMLGREPLSLDWLGGQALRVPGPSAVSRSIASQADLERDVDALLRHQAASPAPGLDRARADIVEDLFFRNDGRGAARVADVVLGCLERREARVTGLRRNARSVAVDIGRRLLGYGLATRLRGGLGRLDAQRRSAKTFSVERVQRILQRLAHTGRFAPLAVSPFASSATVSPRLYSGKSLRVSRVA